MASAELRLLLLLGALSVLLAAPITIGAAITPPSNADHASGAGSGLAVNCLTHPHRSGTGVPCVRNGTQATLTGDSQSISKPGGVMDADFDGDGLADPTIFRLPARGSGPGASSVWYTLHSSSNFSTYSAYSWGTNGDVPIPGDFDGDGKADVAVYRPSQQVWYVLKSSTGYTNYSSYGWGAPGDKPVAGDFDGDGKTDLAVFRPSSGTWFILKSSSGFTTFSVASWGADSDIPVVGDFDGDGKTDITGLPAVARRLVHPEVER
jgi:hypothetical protein